MGFIKTYSKKALKAKGLLSAAIATMGVTASQAAVTVDSATGDISGSLDMSPYYSALSIVIPVTVTLLVGGIILRTIKKA